MVKAATIHPLALAGLGLALVLAGGTAQAQPAPVSVPGPLPHDLSPWGMFTHADPVVQTVMIGLALASVATWTVWLAKTIELYRARQRVQAVLDGLDGIRSLAEANRLIEGRSGPEAHLIRAAMAEAKLSAGSRGEGLKERVATRLERIEVAAGRRMAMGTGILATIGSIAPFVGLFGTVWGIMNSFVGISKSQTTNLAVVAPGIAEALLATALGLVAAIPAVVIYNAFARSVSGYKSLLGDAAALVLRLVSRDLDRRALPLREAAE
ncbi:tonB-system energizer ExbB [Magnetospirillum fulvum]|uniref:Biopolymer transport protein ExbB n=1 Tax=Magnetospirillum fulvum TaxID=1082 RepID=A0A1H6HFN4_MAGFU|nr:tonB-system energizer ExbB [Magnetospirillum fulvum]SEH32900.1 biopolymer transport protein ExbB [Magnetospirillum fulvum]